MAHPISILRMRKATPPFTPVLRTYTTGTSVTETAPAGASNVVIEVWGGGAGGPKGIGGTGSEEYQNAGSTAGYARSSVSIAGGETLTYTVGSAGLGRTSSAGTSGTASTVSSGTKTIATMTANGGTFDNAGGGPVGTASGGTVGNTSGNTGTATSGLSEAAPSGVHANTNGFSGGFGGGSGFGTAGNGSDGGPGFVSFYYT